MSASARLDEVETARLHEIAGRIRQGRKRQYAREWWQGSQCHRHRSGFKQGPHRAGGDCLVDLRAVGVRAAFPFRRPETTSLLEHYVERPDQIRHLSKGTCCQVLCPRQGIDGDRQIILAAVGSAHEGTESGWARSSRIGQSGRSSPWHLSTRWLNVLRIASSSASLRSIRARCSCATSLTSALARPRSS